MPAETLKDDRSLMDSFLGLFEGTDPTGGHPRPDLQPEYATCYDDDLPKWGVLPDYEHPVRYSKEGIHSEAQCSAQTFGSLFRKAAQRFPDDLALAVERPAPAPLGPKNAPSLPEADWTKWTWKDFEDDSTTFAKALLYFQVPQHAAVNVYGFNSPEWHISAVGSILGGTKCVGVYPTDTVDQVYYKSIHANAEIAIIEDLGKLARYTARLDELPQVKAIVLYGVEKKDIPSKFHPRKNGGKKCPIYHWEEFLAFGKTPSLDAALSERTAAIKPGHCALVVYTSGTTGNPKGVMLSHDNIVAGGMANVQELTTQSNTGYGSGKSDPEINAKGVRDVERFLSYLPMSHIAAFLIDISTPVATNAVCDTSAACYFCRNYDLKEGTIRDRLVHVRPTFFVGVPRVWEKFAEAIRAIGAQVTGIKKMISTKLKSKMVYWAKNQQLYGNQRTAVCHHFAASKLHAIKQRLGLDKAKICASGAAPLAVEYFEYFGSLGIQLYEGYGMSECTGATTISMGPCHLWGSIGYAIGGFEVKCCRVKEGSQPGQSSEILEFVSPTSNWDTPAESEQGEICFRGRHIMMGYLANPALGEAHVKEIKEKTAEAIDTKGWMHSGDKGCVNTHNMFKITGRYKELIIGAGGENIAPVPMEDSVKSHCQAISNCMMIGDKLKYNTLLVTLKVDGATGEKPGSNILTGAAKQLGEKEGITTVEQALESDIFKQAIQYAIAKTNADPLVCQNNAWKIQKFYLLAKDFSVEGEEFTPTMKLKRSLVVKKFAKEIDTMY